MSKITRAPQTIFGTTAAANEVEQIGSLRNGSPVFTKDITVLQALAEYSLGLKGIVSSDKNIIELGDLNGLLYMITSQLSYIFQDGVPDWEATTSYYQFSVVKKPGTSEFFVSQTNDNVGNALSDTTNWLPRGDSLLSYNLALDSLDFKNSAGTVVGRLTNTGDLKLVGQIMEGQTL
jgi:hypothetical protein